MLLLASSILLTLRAFDSVSSLFMLMSLVFGAQTHTIYNPASQLVYYYFCCLLIISSHIMSYYSKQRRTNRNTCHTNTAHSVRCAHVHTLNTVYDTLPPKRDQLLKISNPNNNSINTNYATK